MSYFEDLSEYAYLRTACRAGTVNVGWLALGREFDKIEPSGEFLDNLWSYCKISIAETRGAHDCEFCKDSELLVGERKGEKLFLGGAEIRVFSRNGTIFAAPTLIYHYVEVHHYYPPKDFVRAVISEAAPPSREYFDRLESLGLEWRETPVPSDKRVRRMSHKLKIQLPE